MDDLATAVQDGIKIVEGAAAATMTDVQGATNSASPAVPDVLAAFEARISALEAVAKGAGDAVGLGSIVDPLAARVDALEAKAATWEETHPIVGKLVAVVGRLFPQEMK